MKSARQTSAKSSFGACASRARRTRGPFDKLRAPFKVLCIVPEFLRGLERVYIPFSFSFMNETTKFLNSLCGGDLQRFADCLNAFAELHGVDIEDVGYNSNSGNVWIALENGVTIFEGFNGVQYMIFKDDEEEEFETYEAATAAME